MNIVRGISCITITCILLMGYQNCGKFQPHSNLTQSNESSSRLPSSPGEINGGISTGSGQITSWEENVAGPAQSDDCYHDSHFNFCATLKDPVSSLFQIGGFTPAYVSTNSTLQLENSIFRFGLNLPEGELKNDHFVLSAIANSGIFVPTLSSNNSKLRFGGDDNHTYSQVAAFYWLNRQRQFMIERTGQYYFSTKKSKVYAYDTTVSDNAYFSPSDLSIHVGVRKYSTQLKGDLALDTSIIAHEAGHGNLHVASSGQNPIGGETEMRSGGAFCRTRQGCFGAIHEGQADVHAFIFFPSYTPVIGAYFKNDVKGLRSAAQVKIQGLTVDDYFAKNSGEIHDMGEVYASVWYEVWKEFQTRGEEKVVESLFSDHLAFLDSYDNFSTALVSIESLIDQSYVSSASQLKTSFRQNYNRLKIQVIK